MQPGARMKTEVNYQVRVETEDGTRYLWDCNEYETVEAAKAAWTLDYIKKREPNARKLIIVECIERDLLVLEHEIEGTLA